VARHAILFLFAWEVMSLAAYLLVSFDHQEASVRRASFIYLIATHVGVACLLALFLSLGALAHSYEFSAMAATPMPNATIASLLFLFALVGFGAKAGLFPLHVWLPEAHAAAPTHVSAVMSGVLIKLGVYGILRVVLLLGGPRPYWGPVLMTLGIVGGIVGIGCSLYQRDIKRLLAYSSVENVGLIMLGLGTGLWGISSSRPVIATLGMVGGLLHVWNHAIMKGLMFLGAGSLAHRCHSRDIEQLGGLYRRMPQTATVLVVGAMGMAGLPPLNGFVSEWLLYSGLMRAALAAEGRYAVTLLAAIGAVSLIGAMAALCFARLIGVALLGEPRASRAESAKEVSPFMTAPMLVLGGMALTIALIPDIFVGLFQAISAQLLGQAALAVGLPQSRLAVLVGGGDLYCHAAPGEESHSTGRDLGLWLRSSDESHAVRWPRCLGTVHLGHTSSRTRPSSNVRIAVGPVSDFGAHRNRHGRSRNTLGLSTILRALGEPIRAVALHAARDLARVRSVHFGDVAFRTDLERYHGRRSPMIAARAICCVELLRATSNPGKARGGFR
jgi:formate hydrogenlyase subunit 3/multisubunit Na+/H+ antiporter MnhD subunit